MKLIPHLVLTGGTSAGKTTALKYLADRLRHLGFYTITIPDMREILTRNHIATPYGKEMPSSVTERHVFHAILVLENVVRAAAHERPHQRPIILADGGLLDTSARLEESVFDRLIESFGMNLGEIYGRYHAVFHLRTTALGAESFYLRSATSIHPGTPSEARALDERIRVAWSEHPRVTVIESSTNIDTKFFQLLEAVWAALDIEDPRGPIMDQ